MFYFIKGTEPHSDYVYNLDSVFNDEEKQEESINNDDTDT